VAQGPTLRAMGPLLGPWAWALRASSQSFVVGQMKQIISECLLDQRKELEGPTDWDVFCNGFCPPQTLNKRENRVIIRL